MPLAKERRVVQDRGWAWDIKRHYAYDMRDKGYAVDEIIAEVVGIQIEVLERHYNECQ